RPGFVEGGENFLQVMAVNDTGVPAEGGETRLVSRDVMVVHRPLTLSQTVDVDNADEVVEAVVRRHRRGFPHPPLRNFTVPPEHVDAVVQLIELLAVERHAPADGYPLPE